MDAGETPYFIADSARYSEKNIQALSQVKWISRLPSTLKAVQMLYQELEPAHMRPTTAEGYRVAELCSTYGGVRQRWLGVSSAAAYASETQRLQHQVTKEKQEAH